MVAESDMPDARSVKDHWTAKADAWTEWAEEIAPLAEGFNRPLLDALDLRPGQRVLDLASGAGEPVLSAASAIAPDGFAVATDIVPSMLTGLRRRDGGNRLLYAGADMQALPFRSNCFDRVTCRFGVMFVPDAVKALADIQRVLAPRGLTGFIIWGARHDQTMFPLMSDAVEAVTGIAPDSHHFQIFRFGTPGQLASMMHDAGYEAVEEHELRFSPLAPLDKPFWRPQLSMLFGHMLNRISREAQEAIETAIRERLEPLRTEAGYAIKAHIRLVIGMKGK